MTRTRLDTSGLRCPLPVLRAKKALKALEPGDLIDVLATDPAAKTDFPAFCETTGNVLEETEERDGIFRFVIRKCG